MAKVEKRYVYKNGVRLIESKGKQLDNPDYMLDKLKCSIVESEDVVTYDALTDNKSKAEAHLKGLGVSEEEVLVIKPKAKKKVGIMDDDLDFLLELILENFKPEQRFKNAELAKLQTRFTNRQTPSRLKKLVDSGKLLAEGTPKNYYYV